MMKSTKAMAVALAVALGLNGLANAAERTDERSWKWSPLGIGLAAPVQLPFIESDVYGLRVGGLFGYNHDVYGLDVGVAEVCSRDFAGLQASAFSWASGDTYGAQLGALANVVLGNSIALQTGFANANWGDAAGLQLGLVNYDCTYRGVQFGGIINWTDLASYGLEMGLVNANQDEYFGWAFGALVNYSSKFKGFGCGLVNVAYEVNGFQLGLVNACDHMHGVQIGLINLICESPRLPMMFLVNAWF